MEGLELSTERHQAGAAVLMTGWLGRTAML